jgi:AI-2 transport protein TqsA
VVLLGAALMGDLQTKWDTKYYNLTKDKIEQGYGAFEKTLKEWGLQRPEEVPRAVPVEDGEAPASAPGNLLPKVETTQIRELLDRNIQALRSIDFQRVWDLGTDVVGRVVAFFSTAVVVLILTVFMLLEARMFGRRFTAICDARGPNFQRMLSATRDIQRYLGIKTLVSLATGILAGILCWAAGLDFALLWGIAAFLLNFIPVFGSLIAGVPPTLLALLVSGLPSAIAVAGGYVLINNMLGNFIEPMLMGRRFGISTLVVVISVVFWGWLWGPIGMFLAVPLTMMLKVMLDNSEEFRWIGVAIGKEQRRPAEEQRILQGGAALQPPAPPGSDEAPERA